MFLEHAAAIEAHGDGSGPSTGAPAAAALAPASNPFEMFIEANDNDDDDDGSAARPDGASSKRPRIGTYDERWSRRLLRTTIADDLQVGCGCRDQCSDKLTLDEVLTTRTERSKEGAGGPRTHMRDWLPTHQNESNKLGYTLHGRDESTTLCPAAFDILNGFGSGFTYKFIRQHRQGIVADDPNLGGPREQHTQMTGGSFDDDSVKSMALRGWWAELRDDTEVMPNRPTEERQIDYIEPSALYDECRQDLHESGMHWDSIGSYVRVFVGAPCASRQIFALE